VLRKEIAVTVAQCAPLLEELFGRHSLELLY